MTIGPAEIILLIILAIILFGPEKVPVYSRKLARVFVYLRGIANNAQTQLRSELGPEFADIELSDLNPKTLVRKHLASEMALIEQTRAEMREAGQQAASGAAKAKDEVSRPAAAAPEAGAEAAVPEAGAHVGPPLFDVEAT